MPESKISKDDDVLLATPTAENIDGKAGAALSGGAGGEDHDETSGVRGRSIKDGLKGDARIQGVPARRDCAWLEVGVHSSLACVTIRLALGS